MTAINKLNYLKRTTKKNYLEDFYLNILKGLSKTQILGNQESALIYIGAKHFSPRRINCPSCAQV
jgi:hypothetical protein